MLNLSLSVISSFRKEKKVVADLIFNEFALPMSSDCLHSDRIEIETIVIINDTRDYHSYLGALSHDY